ncbi:MAG: hypothetical protein J6B68_05535 [Lachnospiraceae bacterium]|nr:hypothetical protein [Lachnospiraceae bacterium]
MTQVISFIFWLLVVPFCIGLVPVKCIAEKKRNLGVILLAGYLLMWAVFEVITIPAVVWIQYHNFSIAMNIFMVVAVLLAVAGIVLWYMEGKKNEGKTNWLGLGNLKWSEMSLETKIEWFLLFALVGFQLYMSVTRASFDGDDAYYVVQSLMAQQNDAMYKNLPYTGRSADLDVRHALAVFPMWVAFVSVKADLHATIVSHVIMPLVLIPLSYLVYYEISKVLFADKRENRPIFMIIMGLFQLFGNVSIYTNETFFLTRTWQGKAVAGSFVIPMIFLMLFWIFDNDLKKEKIEEKEAAQATGAEKKAQKERKKQAQNIGLWIMLVCVNMTAGVCSSIAVFLVTILLGIAAFCLMLVKRDWKVPVKLGLTCIPNAFYVLLYLILSR